MKTLLADFEVFIEASFWRAPSDTKTGPERHSQNPSMAYGIVLCILAPGRVGIINSMVIHVSSKL